LNLSRGPSAGISSQSSPSQSLDASYGPGTTTSSHRTNNGRLTPRAWNGNGRAMLVSILPKNEEPKELGIEFPNHEFEMNGPWGCEHLPGLPSVGV